MSLLPKVDLSHSVTLKPVSVDDISSVRYVHITAFRILASEHHTEEEIQAHVDLIQRPEYVDTILTSALYCSWIEDEIVGTAGWCPADDNGSTARIRNVFVRPLFTNCGIGRLLVENAEARAHQAGFRDFSVRANINAVSFYERLGYEISSYGVMSTRSNIDLPVAFMRKYYNATHKLSDKTATKKSESVSGDGWWSH